MKNLRCDDLSKTSVSKKSSSYLSCDETSKHETNHGVVDISNVKMDSLGMEWN